LVASILSAGLATDTIAVTDSPKCGVYDYRYNSSHSSVPFLEFEYHAETQSKQYAITCYRNSSQVNDCNKFYCQSISYSSYDEAECPFAGDVCYDPGDSAIQFSTGIQSGAVLGISAANPFLFSRTMTCSPLVTGPEYIGKGWSYWGDEQWEYYYGLTFDGYTWANPVEESNWEIKGYSTG
jgi:hypothetical protein